MILKCVIDIITITIKHELWTSSSSWIHMNWTLNWLFSRVNWFNREEEHENRERVRCHFHLDEQKEGRKVSRWVWTQLSERFTVRLSHLLLTSVCWSHHSKSVSSHLVTDVVSFWIPRDRCEQQVWNKETSKDSLTELTHSFTFYLHHICSSSVYNRTCFHNHTLQQWSPTSRESVDPSKALDSLAEERGTSTCRARYTHTHVYIYTVYIYQHKSKTASSLHDMNISF